MQRPREPVSAVLPRGHIQRLPTHTSFCLLFLRSHALAFKEDASPLPSTGKHSILSYTETQDCPSPAQPRLSVLLVSKAGTYVTKLREGSHTSSSLLAELWSSSLCSYGEAGVSYILSPSSPSQFPCSRSVSGPLLCAFCCLVTTHPPCPAAAP